MLAVWKERPCQPGNRSNTLSLSMSTMGMEAPLSYCNNAAFSGRKTPGLLVQWLSPHGRITRVPRELEQAPPSRRCSLCRSAHACGPPPRLAFFRVDDDTPGAPQITLTGTAFHGSDRQRCRPGADLSPSAPAGAARDRKSTRLNS